jgi:hypothetical protein
MQLFFLPKYKFIAFYLYFKNFFFYTHKFTTLSFNLSYIIKFFQSYAILSLFTLSNKALLKILLHLPSVPYVIKTLTNFFTKLTKFPFIEDAILSDVVLRFVENLFQQKISIYLNRIFFKHFNNFEKFLIYNVFDHISIIFKTFYIKSDIKSYKSYKRFWKLNNRTLFFRNFETAVVLISFFIYKDTLLLTSFLRYNLQRMSLFKHRVFIVRLFKILKLLFIKTKDIYNILGLKVRITGKLSVTGNARTRSVYFQTGLTNKSNLETKVDYSFTSINTETGCLGLSV